MGKIYQYDKGKKFRVDTAVDLSEATLVRLDVKNSSGTMAWTPTVTSGDAEYGETEGMTILEYISQSEDLLTLGLHILVAYAEWTPSSTHNGEPATFIVYEKFKPIT